MIGFPFHARLLTVLGCLVLLPLVTFGDNGSGGLFGGGDRTVFAYDYFDLGYLHYQFDDGAVENASGFGGKLSLPIVGTFFGTASLGFATPDTSDGESLDYVTWKLGAGLGIPLSHNLDFVIEGGLAREKFTADILADPVDGYGTYVTPGLRLMLGDFIELNGGVSITNIDSQTETGVDLKALLHLTPTLSLFGNAYYTEEVSQYGLGLRLSF
ncbi:MAG: hypothetical protein HKN23_03100 [Verrucomicrobiales bacterium]|nr:hypothetical protein [Verrucomicrobiales bacterium]